MSQRTLNAALTALPTHSAATLRQEWQRLHGAEPSLCLSPDLMRRGIAYKLQEATLGGMPSALRKHLLAAASGEVTSQPVASIAPAHLSRGTTLVRDWHGQTYTVTVLQGGFDYLGRHYASLSQIAREITGVGWSGPRFFGLHRKERGRMGGVGADA